MRLVFFYPSKGVGGAQVLFARIAEAFASKGVAIVVVDFNGGYISDYLKTQKVEFLHICLEKTRQFFCRPEDFLLLSLSMIFGFEGRLLPHQKTRIAFWDLHPYNLIENTAFSYFYKNFLSSKVKWIFRKMESTHISKIASMVDFLTERNALYFMCQKNYSINKDFFDFHASPLYLPIALPIDGSPGFISSARKTVRPAGRDGCSRSESAVINVGWISRLDPDKIPILNLLLSDVDRFSSEKNTKVVFHVIGEGSAVDEILKFSSFEVRMLGRIEKDALSKYIAEKIDVGFSMGTSVLEFAAREKPAVMVPGPTQYEFFKKDLLRYVWLPNAEGFDVAVEEYYDTGKRNSFEAIVNAYQGNPAGLGQSCRDYVMKNHDLQSVVENLGVKFDRANFTYFHYKNERIFSQGLLSLALGHLKVFAKSLLAIYRRA